MAKEVIFVVSWLRPLKLIGLCNLVCGIIAFILSMVLEDWVLSDESETHQYYMSLWNRCLKKPDELPQTTTATTAAQKPEFQCTDARILGDYMSVVQGLIIIPFVIAIIAFVVGCIAYCKREWRNLYKIAGVILIIAAILVLVAVILFPVMFLQDLPFFAFFWFGWGYGIAWAAMCFILAAGILFLISQDKKELYRASKRMTI